MAYAIVAMMLAQHMVFIIATVEQAFLAIPLSIARLDIPTMNKVGNQSQSIVMSTSFIC